VVHADDMMAQLRKAGRAHAAYISQTENTDIHTPINSFSVLSAVKKFASDSVAGYYTIKRQNMPDHYSDKRRRNGDFLIVAEKINQSRSFG
jgi:hypothetical protein